MLPTLTAPDITHALDHFSPQYHRDFQSVRSVARTWLDGVNPTPHELPALLRDAVVSWGAGMRRAPVPRSNAEIEAVLNTPAAGKALRALHQLKLHNLTLVDGEKRIDGKLHVGNQQQISQMLLHALDVMDGLFQANTAVTYPSKALLLLTGRYVGLDMNVRTSIASAGERGFRETRFAMPDKPNDRSAQRVSRVLWLTGDWLARHQEAVREALSLSTSPHDLAHLDAPARVVDIVLFQRGKDARNA